MRPLGHAHPGGPDVPAQRCQPWRAGCRPRPRSSRTHGPTALWRSVAPADVPDAGADAPCHHVHRHRTSSMTWSPPRRVTPYRGGPSSPALAFVQTAWFSTFLAFGNVMNMIVGLALPGGPCPWAAGHTPVRLRAPGSVVAAAPLVAVDSQCLAAAPAGCPQSLRFPGWSSSSGRDNVHSGAGSSGGASAALHGEWPAGAEDPRCRRASLGPDRSPTCSVPTGGGGLPWCCRGWCPGCRVPAGAPGLGGDGPLANAPWSGWHSSQPCSCGRGRRGN